jgi:hypothetical protein
MRSLRICRRIWGLLTGKAHSGGWHRRSPVLYSLEEIACGDFFGHQLRLQRQKAWFLPLAFTRSYARAGLGISFVSGLTDARKQRVGS